MTDRMLATSFTFDASSRRWTYGTFLFWAVLYGCVRYYFGAERWISRLYWYGLIALFILACVAFVSYRREVWLMNREDNRSPIGEQNLFSTSDRDPTDRRLI